MEPLEFKAIYALHASGTLQQLPEARLPQARLVYQQSCPSFYCEGNTMGTETARHDPSASSKTSLHCQRRRCASCEAPGGMTQTRICFTQPLRHALPQVNKTRSCRAFLPVVWPAARTARLGAKRGYNQLHDNLDHVQTT